MNDLDTLRKTFIDASFLFTFLFVNLRAFRVNFDKMHMEGLPHHK